MKLKVESFLVEIKSAMDAYEKYIICLNKTPDQFLESVQSLMIKAIAAYENRPAELKNGIALDNQITIIISDQINGPLCSIYFNLHSPYLKVRKKQNKK